MRFKNDFNMLVHIFHLRNDYMTSQLLLARRRRKKWWFNLLYCRYDELFSSFSFNEKLEKAQNEFLVYSMVDLNNRSKADQNFRTLLPFVSISFNFSKLWRNEMKWMYESAMRIWYFVLNKPFFNNNKTLHNFHVEKLWQCLFFMTQQHLIMLWIHYNTFSICKQNVAKNRDKTIHSTSDL